MVDLHWDVLDPKMDPPRWWISVGMFLTQIGSTTMVDLHWDVLDPKMDPPWWWITIGMFLTPKWVHHHGGPPLGHP